MLCLFLFFIFTTTKALKIFLHHSLGSQAGPEEVDAECCDNGIGDAVPVSHNSLSLSLKKDVFFIFDLLKALQSLLHFAGAHVYQSMLQCGQLGIPDLMHAEDVLASSSLTPVGGKWT